MPHYEAPADMEHGAQTSDPAASLRAAFISRVRIDRAATRSVAALAEQLQDETVALMHEERGLVDETRRCTIRY